MGIVYKHSSMQVSQICSQQTQHRTRELCKSLQLRFKYPKLMLASQLQSHIIMVLKNNASNKYRNQFGKVVICW